MKAKTRYCVQRKVNGQWVDRPGWLPDTSSWGEAMQMLELGRRDFQTKEWRILSGQPDNFEVDYETN
jgi:hypothetical protein